MAPRNRRTWVLTPDSTANRTTQSRTARDTTEEIFIRNYDHQWGYDLDLVVATPDGEPVFRKQYYLQPGHTVSERDVLRSADYQLHVTLDNSHEESRQCRIDSSPAHTAVIEVGNGVLSLTEGLQS